MNPMYTYTHTTTHTRMYTHTHTYTHTHMYNHTHMHECINVYIHTYDCMTHTHTHLLRGALDSNKGLVIVLLANLGLVDIHLGVRLAFDDLDVHARLADDHAHL